MSDPIGFATILGNLTRQSAVDVDGALFPKGEMIGADISFAEDGPPVSSALWGRGENQNSFIGIRVESPIANPHGLASDLAAIAIERQIIPIFLSHIGQCGMQRLGFRVEFVGGADASEREACEDQLKRFWNLAIIVDADDISAFG